MGNAGIFAQYKCGEGLENFKLSFVGALRLRQLQRRVGPTRPFDGPGLSDGSRTLPGPASSDRTGTGSTDRAAVESQFAWNVTWMKRRPMGWYDETELMPKDDLRRR